MDLTFPPSPTMKRLRTSTQRDASSRKRRMLDPETSITLQSAASPSLPSAQKLISPIRQTFIQPHPCPLDQLLAATQQTLSYEQPPATLLDISLHCQKPEAQCAAINCPSPPCNDPSCDDGIPCQDVPSSCNDKACAGELCFDRNCHDPAASTWCDQGCEQTHCADPCYSPDCDAQPCYDDCPDEIDNHVEWDTHPYFNMLASYQDPGQDGLASALECGCVDPRCLQNSFCVHPPGHGLDSDHVHDIHSSRICGAKETSYEHALRSKMDSTYFRTPHQHFGPTYLSGNTSDAISRRQDMWPSSIQDPGTPALTAASSTTTPSTSHSRTPQIASASTYPSYSRADAVSYRWADTKMSSSGSSGISQVGTAPTRVVDALVCGWIHSGTGDVCGLRFESAAELHAHVEKTHIEKLQREDNSTNGFYCHWTGCDRYLCRSFAARPKLKRHMQTHTLHKPFECPTCGITMKTKDAMEKHERTHSGTRPYACEAPGCGKTFATSTELKTHTVVHSGEKPHVCGICGEAFADSSNLSKHKKTHFLGMWRCDVCGVRMKRWDQMRRHVQSQGHMKGLLEDDSVQKDYKARMEREWKELPDEQRCLQLGKRSG